MVASTYPQAGDETARRLARVRAKPVAVRSVAEMIPLTSSPTAARLTVLSLACAAALGLGACGGDDDGDGAPETAPTDAAATTTDGDTTSTTTETPTGQGNDPRAQVEEVLSTLLAQQGLSDEQIDCVVDELRQSVSDAEIADAITNSRLSNAVIGAATEAALSCRDAGG
jgi:hypothetical protein